MNLRNRCHRPSPFHVVTILAILWAVPVVAQPHSGSSPFVPPEEADTTFIIDTSPGLDRGCTYRDFGPRVIQVPNKRYVGPVDGNGYLLNPTVLHNNGVVSANVRITMPVYDIDSSANVPPYAPEIDEVYFNGHFVGNLSGENNVWKQNEFEVPVEWVKFPARGSDGTPPTPAQNEIRVLIDVGNAPTGNLVWCMDIDWIALEYEAMAPLLLVHGTNADSGTWNGPVIDRLNQMYVPFSNDINFDDDGNASIDHNGAQLRGRVAALAASFGAKKVHLVAHSKGGLDCRRFLSAYAGNMEVEVLSLFTISSPHGGTIVSDLADAHRNLNDPQSEDPLVSEFFDRDSWLVRNFGPRGAALVDQTVPNMANFNASNPYASAARFYNFVADADVNGNRVMDANEIQGMSGIPFQNDINAWNMMYQVLGRIAGITVTRETNWWGLNEWHVVTPIPTTSFQDNDLVVTARSAHHPAGTQLGGIQDDNHSTVKSTDVTNMIVARIRGDFPVH